jgi:hypothetical protein
MFDRGKGIANLKKRDITSPGKQVSVVLDKTVRMLAENPESTPLPVRMARGYGGLSMFQSDAQEFAP